MGISPSVRVGKRREKSCVTEWGRGGCGSLQRNFPGSDSRFFSRSVANGGKGRLRTNVYFMLWRFVPLALCKTRLFQGLFPSSTPDPAGSGTQLFDKISVIGRQAALFSEWVATQGSARRNADFLFFFDCVSAELIA